jgi:hypothetical protein
MSELYVLMPGEKEIHNVRGVFLKAKLLANTGQIVLTNKRLIFIKDANPGAGILLSLLIRSLGKSIQFETILTEIKNIKHTPFAMDKSRVTFELNSGRMVTMTSGKIPYEEWVRVFDELKVGELYPKL